LKTERQKHTAYVYNICIIGMRNFEDIRTLKETNEETSTFPALYDMIEELYDDSSIENNDDTMFKPITDSVRLTFTCTRQVVASVLVLEKLTLSVM